MTLQNFQVITITRDELALANMKFLKECVDGEHSNDFDEKDLLNIAHCAKSLSYSRSTCKKIEAFCERLDKYAEQKHANLITQITFFALIEDEIQLIIEELTSNVYS
jgi:hypothetical protein